MTVYENGCDGHGELEEIRNSINMGETSETAPRRRRYLIWNYKTSSRNQAKWKVSGRVTWQIEAWLAGLFPDSPHPTHPTLPQDAY